MATDAQKRAKNKYGKKVKRITVNFYPTERELFAHLSNQENKQGYIKSLIREEMLRDGPIKSGE